MDPQSAESGVEHAATVRRRAGPRAHVGDGLRGRSGIGIDACVDLQPLLQTLDTNIARPGHAARRVNSNR
jgi:hypothetical protein